MQTRVVAKDAKGTAFDAWVAQAKCRHSYFKKWAAFQDANRLASSTCIGPRFTDNGDQTITDNLTSLVWEKKDNLGGLHDKDDTYTWSSGPPYAGTGTVFTTFIGGLNQAGFAGANDWRLPTLEQLQTIVLDFPCTGAGQSPTCSCSTSPCIDPIFDSSNTQDNGYWTINTYTPNPVTAWGVGFSFNGGNNNKVIGLYARAVRGGF